MSIHTLLINQYKFDLSGVRVIFTQLWIILDDMENSRILKTMKRQSQTH